jgi:hypothetical protein
VKTRQFSNAKHFNSVLRIFTRLPSISGLASLTPRLYGQDRNELKIKLQYPDCHIWRLNELVWPHNGWWNPTRMQVHQLRRLRDTLLHDIHILCASHIAVSSDISLLRVVQQAKPVPNFRALLDQFEPGMCTEQNGNTINWTELGRDLVRKVEIQFPVFEVRGWIAHGSFAFYSCLKLLTHAYHPSSAWSYPNSLASLDNNPM